MKTSLHLFTIPASADFAQSLARGLVARSGGGTLEIARARIYLPTRRAARGFGEAFAKVLGGESLRGGAALLPQFHALGESDEEEAAFDAVSEGVELKPAIDPIRRQLLLAALIRRWDEQARGGSLNTVQALHLAASLATVMDEVERQGADLNNLQELAPLSLAEHWREVVGFLDLMRTNWPAILQDEGRVNPAAHRNEVMKLLRERISGQNQPGMVIAAGSTGSIPATARLLRTIARLDHGAVVLPGLDRGLDESSWNDLDPGHPQFGMKQLLAEIGATRADVADWDEQDARPARTLLLRETLRPAPTTDAWRAIADRGPEEIARSLEGMS
ncbi:MAG TPA: hypothetical protein VG501_02790, partial [Rhizomicrobium sp.]|nr:hypothetical protein [Rhizomicrobium sp.]